MARPLTRITPEQDVFWVDALRALESQETTRELIMAITGVSERTLKRRLARARLVRNDIECDAELKHDGVELPWVELVNGTEPDHPHYDLGSDRLIKPPGPFRIGDHHGRRLKIQHAGNGKPVEKVVKSKAKFKPKGA